MRISKSLVNLDNDNLCQFDYYRKLEHFDLRLNLHNMTFYFERDGGWLPLKLPFLKFSVWFEC